MIDDRWTIVRPEHLNVLEELTEGFQESIDSVGSSITLELINDYLHRGLFTLLYEPKQRIGVIVCLNTDNALEVVIGAYRRGCDLSSVVSLCESLGTINDTVIVKGRRAWVKLFKDTAFKPFKDGSTYTLILGGRTCQQQ